jgi:hypothetical protein
MQGSLGEWRVGQDSARKRSFVYTLDIDRSSNLAYA